MRPVLLLASAPAILLLGASAWSSACKSDDSAAVPTGPAATGAAEAGGGGSSSGGSDASTGNDAAATDSSAPVDTGTTPGTDGGDAATGPSDGGDSGPADAAHVCTTVQAKFDFAATSSTLNGGLGQLLTVHVCDTVVWTNDDGLITHGVESTGGGFSFGTGTLAGTAAGVAFPPVQFTMAGVFTYDCSIHGNMMVGQITVEP